MRTIDLNDHLNLNRLEGQTPRVCLSNVRLAEGAAGTEYASRAMEARIPFARAVVNAETGEPISIVGSDYQLVPHGQILEAVESAVHHIAQRDSDVPRGIYFSNRGAKMRALFKFTRFRRNVTQNDELCPVIRITNSYDRSTRITIEIGAFRFACTNFAIGGGIFAGGFSAIHQGEIDVTRIQHQLETFLDQFDLIVETFRRWLDTPWTSEDATATAAQLEPFGSRHLSRIPALTVPTSAPNRFRAYNDFTFHATHRTRTANVAFRFLDATNDAFHRIDRLDAGA